MVQNTRWEGTKTKQLRKAGKLRGGYTRYSNRFNRSGLQIVKNKKYYNEIFTPDGKFIGIEPKYKNFSTDDRQAKHIFETQIRPKLSPKLRQKILR